MSAYLGNKQIDVGLYVETDKVILSTEEFNSIPVKDPNTMYLVYDDPITVNTINHLNNDDIHVTIEDKERWNNISDSSHMASYLAFVANNNDGQVNAAFGKNNEDLVKGIGKALAMYSWYMGDNKIEHPFSSLVNQ